MFCPACREPLLYPSSPNKKEFFLDQDSPWDKFSDFLPLGRFKSRLSLGEGNTPLLRLSNLKERMDSCLLFAKNETLNPTGSFKDRGTVMAVQKAVSLGIRKIGTVSTGNMASSTAAYGAKAGLETVVLVKEDITAEKLFAAAVFRPILIRVKGDYGELFHRSFSLGKKFGIYFMNSVDPFRIEGYKATGFEVFFQLHKKSPDYVFVPLSSGGHLIGLMKSFLELKQQGLISTLPVFIGVQARGCSPLSLAFASNKTKYRRIEKAKTIAHAISNPDPPGGNIVLKLIRENSGKIIDVSDREMLSAQKMLAEREGIFCLPDSATALAGFIKLSKKKKFQKQDRVVLVITGTGLKSMGALDAREAIIHRASLQNLEQRIKALKG